jgi:hypothetical protein
MSQLLKNPSDISNYIDELTSGIGARGSSFRDVDRLTVVHNGGHAGRFLFQELKWREEWDNQTPGQFRSLTWTLEDLVSASSRFTVWRVIVEFDWSLTVKDFRKNIEKNLTAEGYQAAFKKWWFPGVSQ